MIEVWRDPAGLRTAMAEMLENSLRARVRRSLAQRMKGATNADRALAGLEDHRTLADGYYAWAGHLVLLDRVVRQAAPRTALRIEELRGLADLGGVEAEFERAHPRCPRCGEMQTDAAELRCWNCGKEFGAPR